MISTLWALLSAFQITNTIVTIKHTLRFLHKHIRSHKCMIQKKLNQSFMIHDIQWNSYHSQHRERHPHPTTPSESSCCINGPSTSPGAICIHRKALSIASCFAVMDVCIQIILRHYCLKSRCHLLWGDKMFECHLVTPAMTYQIWNDDFQVGNCDVRGRLMAASANEVLTMVTDLGTQLRIG